MLWGNDDSDRSGFISIMETIKEIVVVEGKTDTAILKKIYGQIDTIETKGLALNKETLQMIQKAGQTRGIIILTDPDYPGRKIRDQIQRVVPNCKHAFVKQSDAIYKNKVGIAEAKEESIIQALENHVSFHENQQSITWEEFLTLQIIGNSKKRKQLYELFHLGFGNVKTLYKRMNMVGITLEQVHKALEK